MRPAKVATTRTFADICMSAAATAAMRAFARIGMLTAEVLQTGHLQALMCRPPIFIELELVMEIP